MRVGVLFISHEKTLYNAAHLYARPHTNTHYYRPIFLNYADTQTHTITTNTSWRQEQKPKLPPPLLLPLAYTEICILRMLRLVEATEGVWG